MNDRVNRKQKLVRLRGCEHRRAQAGLAQAQSDLARLTDLADRLGQLRADLAVSRDMSAGSDLRIIGEMAARLDLARTALDGPMRAAAELRRELDHETGRTAARRDAATQMLADERRDAEAQAERRRDAAQIARTNPLKLRVLDGGIA